MSRLGSATIVAAISLLLAGCHADITYRFDVHRDNTVTASLKEVIDDQLYSLAASQSSGDPFGRAIHSAGPGWVVKRSTDDVGNHVLVMTKDFTADDLSRSGDRALPSPAGKTLPFSPSSMKTVRGLFTDWVNLDTTIPAPMPKNVDSSENSYAAAGAAIASSIIGLHLELRTPGRLTSTNGEITPDGFARWNINLQQPTDVQYTVQTADVPHILIAVVVALLIIALVFVVARRRREARTLTLMEAKN